MSAYIRESDEGYKDVDLSIKEAYFLFKKGLKYSENNENKKAIQFFYMAFARWNDPRFFFYIAKEYEKLENYSQAILSYYKVIEEKSSIPKNILKDTYINLSILLFNHKNDFYQADKLLYKAYILSEKGKAYPYIAEKLLEKKANTLLEKLVNKWLSEDPNNYKPYTYLGFVALEKGEYEKAEKLFLKSFELYPDSEYKNYLKSLDFNKIKQSYGNIKQKIKELSEKEDKDYKDLLQLGLLYLFEEQYETAENIFLQAKQMFLEEYKTTINESSSFSMGYIRRED